MALNYLTVGQKIRAARKRKGLSQSKLSEIVKCSPTYLSYIENGYRSMSLDLLIAIANALNVTTDELLVDSLENTVRVSNHSFSTLLSDCNDYERVVLLDVASSVKESLRNNRAKMRRVQVS